MFCLQQLQVKSTTSLMHSQHIYIPCKKLKVSCLGVLFTIIGTLSKELPIITKKKA